MSKAGVHFFLCILGMLPRFNFLEIRIFFWKDLPVLGWGRRFLASVSYCTSALLKGVDSAQTLTRKSKGTQLQSPTDLFPDSYLELYRSPMSSPMCSIISCLVGIQQRSIDSETSAKVDTKFLIQSVYSRGLQTRRPLQKWIQNLLCGRYTVEVYRLGDLCKSGY